MDNNIMYLSMKGLNLIKHNADTDDYTGEIITNSDKFKHTWDIQLSHTLKPSTQTLRTVYIVVLKDLENHDSLAFCKFDK